METNSQKTVIEVNDIEDVVRNMVEVRLVDPGNFLAVMETLTRIGVAGLNNKLHQSCHILQKKGRYYIVHFKELFMLDGKPSNFTEEDRQRRNKIASLLEGWGLVEILNKEVAKVTEPSPKTKIIKYSDKDKWELIAKYKIGPKGKSKKSEDAA